MTFDRPADGGEWFVGQGPNSGSWVSLARLSQGEVTPQSRRATDSGGAEHVGVRRLELIQAPPEAGVDWRG